MYLLSMRFKVPAIAKVMLTDKNGNVDYQRAQAFFSDETVDDIIHFPGLKWKVWGLSKDLKEGSGYYLFDNLHDAEVRKAYAEKYYPKSGYKHVRCWIDVVLEDYSVANHAPIYVPANPPMTAEQEKEIMNPEKQSKIKKTAGMLKRYLNYYKK